LRFGLAACQTAAPMQPSAAEKGRQRPVVEIAPSVGWRAVSLRELWDYRDLLSVLVWRDLKVRYRQTVLGAIWVVVQPLTTMLVFTVLFNRVARIEAGAGVPYSLFVMAALVPWTFFSNGVLASSNSLLGSQSLISKVYFPRLLLPAASVVAAAVDGLVTLMLVVGMFAWYGIIPAPALFLLPVAGSVCLALALGLGLWLSALSIEYRDARVVVPFLMQFWLYATPVVYPRHVLPQRLQTLALLNPMTSVVEAFRAALLGTPVSGRDIASGAALAAAVFASGAFYFRRMERTFADVI
jgi:lipopolysaccharide transport system permease protein